MRPILGIFAILVLLLCAKCDSTEVAKPVKINRITVIEHTVVNGHGYSIIMVDNVEYIVDGNGGICPLVKTVN